MGVFCYPLHRCIAVLYGSREFVFGGEPVINRDHNTADAVGELAAQHIVRIQVAQYPSPTVEIDQNGKGRSSLRRIDAYRYLTSWASYLAILYLSGCFWC